MSVKEIRFKFILCFLMLFPPLLLSHSLAYPDLYFHDNFLVGQSPYTVDDEDFTQSSGTELWENYFPSVATDIDVGLKTGLVTTFNDKYMSGTSIPSAVPLVDVDVLAGRTWTLPAGNCFVLYSKSGQYYTVATSANVAQLNLGTTYPTSLSQYDGYAMDSTGSVLNYGIGYGNSFNLSWFTSNFSKMFVTNSRSITLRSDTASDIAISPYSWNKVVLVYNYSASPITCYLNYYDRQGGDIEVPSIPMNSVRWIFTVCHTGNINGAVAPDYKYTSYVSVMPHIKGSINLYSYPYNTVVDDNDDKEFYIGTYFEQTATVTYSGGYLNFSGFDNGLVFKKHDIHFPTSYLSSSSSIDLIPVFLDDSFFTELYNKALYIRNGYVDITNYDDLVSKLQEAGIGGGDLSQIIALLEKIDSGGDTGQAVSDLMNILDSYHDNIVGTGDNGWDTINNTFDLYKYLLDFSADSIHWIVVANNALFNYFSGFLILCAFFLVIDRIMRG